ncbi:hypothetical protein [Methylocystis sp.]|uniref:hypothetical protein n=1 Tax=Methylocystis sp. TaxID=1911079 RepID=UPI002736A14F|nr:hypothetical protein [Methylocystis sp.]MDP3554858.1 hypothetical protein [Methylocystis sp.]
MSVLQEGSQTAFGKGAVVQSPELRALLTQMAKESETFDARLRALQDNVIEVRIAARNVMQCARAVAVMADGVRPTDA